MIKKLFAAMFALALVAAPLSLVTGCAEDEITHVEEKQIIHETQPQDVSPGTEVVE